MIPVRTQAPESRKIEHLEYPIPSDRILSSGIRLITVPPRSNQVVKLSIYWPWGDLYQKGKYQAKATLDLCLNGTGQRTADQIQEQFEFWGSSVSPNSQMLYSDMDLKATSEYFDDSFKWLIDNHINAIFPEKELTTLQQVAIASLRRRQSTPKYWAYRECAGLVFGSGSAMCRFTEEQDIQALTSGDLKMFHESFLHPSRAVFFLSGDYSDATIDMIDRTLSSYTPPDVKNQPAPSFTDSPTDISEKTHVVENTTQVSMFLMRSLPEIGETEYHRFSLLNMILGGFFGSRLMQEIREEKGLTYGIGSYIMQTPQGNAWCISGEMNRANAGLAVDETRAILRSLIQNPPVGEELERAKRYYTGQLRSSFDGPFAMASKMKGLMVRGYGLAHYDNAMETIWSCTTEDLCRIADNYLHPQSFKTVLAGKISKA